MIGFVIWSLLGVFIIRLGIKDTFGKSGKAEELMKYFKIDAESIVKEVLK